MSDHRNTGQGSGTAVGTQYRLREVTGVTGDSIVDGADNPQRTAAVSGLGELCITGPHLAIGYLGAPTLTAERFVELPDGERALRTGIWPSSRSPDIWSSVDAATGTVQRRGTATYR